MPNCALLDPPHFSLPSTFKHKNLTLHLVKVEEDCHVLYGQKGNIQNCTSSTPHTNLKEVLKEIESELFC
jgi:hypothetical protein